MNLIAYLIFLFWILFILNASKVKNSTLIILGSSWWFFWNLIVCFSFNGIKPPSYSTEFVYFLFFLGISFGLYFKNTIIIPPLLKFIRLPRFIESREKVLIKFLIFAVFPVMVYFLVRSYHLLVTVYKYDKATYRSEVFGLITGTSSLFHNMTLISDLYWSVLHPILWASMIIGISRAIRIKKFDILVFSFVLFLIDSLITVGRFGTHYVLITVVTIIIIEFQYFKQLSKQKVKYAILILFGFIVLMYYMITIKGGDNWKVSLGFYLIGYHTASFGIMDLELNNPNSILFDKTLGLSFFSGLVSIPIKILNSIFGAQLTNHADVMGAYLHENRLIGEDDIIGKLYYNAFGSIFFSMFRDGGRIFIFIYGFAIGYLFNIFSKGFSLKNSFTVSLAFSIYYILIYGIFQPFTSGPILPAIFLIIVFYKYKWV